ncbi:MAG: DUF6519 domain-containing protein, partial [Rhodanobacter sp.]
AVGDWVELLDDDITLAQQAWPLRQVIAINMHSGSVSLSEPISSSKVPLPDPNRHALLRRWDQRSAARSGSLQNPEAMSGEGVLTLLEGQWIELEDGVQIRFESGGLYANGDYWTLPARVADNGVLDWPQEMGADGELTAAAVAASGNHHYGLLGLTSSDGYNECCCRFPSICGLMRDSQAGPAKKMELSIAAASTTAKVKAKAQPKPKPKAEPK